SKLDPTGSQLRYSTYLGEPEGDFAYAIALDSGRDAYVTGTTANTQAPRGDAYLKKLDPTGATLMYSTTLGVPDIQETGVGLAVDSEESAYVVGTASS